MDGLTAGHHQSSAMDGLAAGQCALGLADWFGQETRSCLKLFTTGQVDQGQYVVVYVGLFISAGLLIQVHAASRCG